MIFIFHPSIIEVINDLFLNLTIKRHVPIELAQHTKKIVEFFGILIDIMELTVRGEH